MDNPKDTIKKLVLGVVVICVAAFVIGLFFVGSVFHYALGIVGGMLITILRLFVAEKAIEKALDLSKPNAENYVRLNFIFKMAIVAVFLFFAIKFNIYTFWGGAIAVSSLQLSALLTKMLIKNPESANRLKD